MAGGAEALPRDNEPCGGMYEIQVHGIVERHWELDLGMRLTYRDSEVGTISTLVGPLPDQAVLLDVLDRLTMWGYLIVGVRHLPERGSEEQAEA